MTTEPLADQVRAACGHCGVPKIGGCGCGPCWENTIRLDTLRNTTTGSDQ